MRKILDKSYGYQCQKAVMMILCGAFQFQQDRNVYVHYVCIISSFQIYRLSEISSKDVVT